VSSLYLIAITIPEPYYTELQTIQDEFAVVAWKKRIGSHITLFRPFQIETGTVNDVVNGLTTVAQKFKPFQIRASKIDTFKHDNLVIYAKVELSQELAWLQEDILDTIKQYTELQSDDYDAYHPHITLANKLTPAVFDDFLPKIKHKFQKFDFACSEFTLFKVQDTAWDPIKSFHLR